MDPRTEQVMLEDWNARLFGEYPEVPRGHYSWDSKGLKVIVRGQGKIQNDVHAILDMEPDNSGHEVVTYTLGYKDIGSARY